MASAYRIVLEPVERKTMRACGAPLIIATKSSLLAAGRLYYQLDVASLLLRHDILVKIVDAEGRDVTREAEQDVFEHRS